MAKETPSQVVSSLGGSETAVPPLTPDRKAASDNRMSKLAQHALRNAGASTSVKPNGAKDEKTGGDKTEGAAPKPETSQNKPDSQTTPSQTQPTSKKEESGTENEKGVDYWTEESKKHQSRADKAEQKLKELEPEITKRDDTIKELGKYKEQVEGFVADPITFMTKYAPSLAQKLAQAGDPIKLLEDELRQFQQKLDEQYFTQYGQDWKYNEVAAMQPGTPEFRYKLAMDDRRNQIIADYRAKVEADRKRVADAEVQIQEDKKKLSTEYGFTAEDFAEADKFFKENKLSYYTLAKAALFDRILAKKLEGIVTSPGAPPDVSTVGTRGENGGGKDKPKLSEGTRQVLSRMGVRSIH